MVDFFKKIFPYIKRFFYGRFEKWITRTLIGTGTLILVSGLCQNVWLSFFVNIYNDLYNRNVKDPQASDNNFLIVVEVIVGLFLIIVGLFFYSKNKNREKINPMVKIEHSSIETVNFTKINKDLSDYQVESFPLNQLEEMKQLDTLNINHALREQEKLVERVAQRLDGNSSVELSYFGLAHIPLTLLIGFQMSDKLHVCFYEWSFERLTWEKIESKPNAEYPTLLLKEKVIVQESQNIEEVVITIEVTYPIFEEQIKELQLDHLNSYNLYLDPPRRNAISSIEQLESYKSTFRGLLDHLNQSYPNLETVHLFYSGQPSLAYTLGSAISSRMDPDIWIYNHVRTETPKYKWAIKLPIKSKKIAFKTN